MIKVSEVLNKYADYEVDENELEKILVRPRPKTVWELKKGDVYHYLRSDGIIVESTWNDYSPRMRECCNCFLTREEAEFELERRKCEAIMLKHGTRDMMSLGDEDEDKYVIYYSNCDKKLGITDYLYVNQQGTIFFATKKLAKEVIEEIGEERLKKYIFNVKEHEDE